MRWHVFASTWVLFLHGRNVISIMWSELNFISTPLLGNECLIAGTQVYKVQMDTSLRLTFTLCFVEWSQRPVVPAVHCTTFFSATASGCAKTMGSVWPLKEENLELLWLTFRSHRIWQIKNSRARMVDRAAGLVPASCTGCQAQSWDLCQNVLKHSIQKQKNPLCFMDKKAKS